MERSLVSRELTPRTCECGSRIWDYYQANYDSTRPIADQTWSWYFICEAGHIQPQQPPPADQLILI